MELLKRPGVKKCYRLGDCVGGQEGDFEEVARPRVDSVRASGGKLESMLRRKMGRKSRSAQRGEGEGGGQCSGGRHTSTARMEVQGRICSLNRLKHY